MISVGVDMVEIDRIKKSMKNSKFLNRILGDDEYNLLKKLNFPCKSVAGNFCAKEAFSKAVGTGFRGIRLKEVQILRDTLNKPFIKLTGNASQLYGDGSNDFSVSITHTKELACAVVVLSSEELRPWSLKNTIAVPL